MKHNILTALFFLAILSILSGCKEKCMTCETVSNTYRNDVIVNNSTITVTQEVCDDDLKSIDDATVTTTWKEGIANYKTIAVTKCK